MELRDVVKSLNESFVYNPNEIQLKNMKGVVHFAVDGDKKRVVVFPAGEESGVRKALGKNILIGTGVINKNFIRVSKVTNMNADKAKEFMHSNSFDYTQKHMDFSQILDKNAVIRVGEKHMKTLKFPGNVEVKKK